MHQLNVVDYSFMSNAWSNTSIINGFFFLESNNINNTLKSIQKNILLNIENNVFYRMFLEKDSSSIFFPFLKIGPKPTIDNCVSVETVESIEKDFEKIIKLEYSKVINPLEKLWHIHIVLCPSQQKIAVIMRMHHVMGDGSVFFDFVKSLFNPKKSKLNKIKYINNKNIYLIFNIIRWYFYSFFNVTKGYIKGKANRNLPENIYSEKWQKQHSKNKIIKYETIEYSYFKILMNRYSLNFQSLILYLYSKTCNQFIDLQSKTLLAGVAINTTDHKYGSYIHTLLCNTHGDLFKESDEQKIMNLIKNSFEEEQKYFYRTEAFNKHKIFCYSPFKKHYRKAWAYFFPKSANTYLSITNHRSMKLKIDDVIMKNYYVIQPYPEIHGSSGVSINVHRNEESVNLTLLGYQDRVRSVENFLTEFKNNLINMVYNENYGK